MVSASDVGKMIKPFVFLDLIATQEPIGQQGFGWHPHSGIASRSRSLYRIPRPGKNDSCMGHRMVERRSSAPISNPSRSSELEHPTGRSSMTHDIGPRCTLLTLDAIG
jgi:hypothetical protein